MQDFDVSDLQKLYIPPSHSHKGQNGKLLLIGGSHLFHAASLWSLSIASKVVDMVFYASVPENNRIVENAKEEFRNGMVISRKHIEDYVQEADAVLLGPGMVRTDGRIMNHESRIMNLETINRLEDEGEQSYYLTKYLLEKYPEKKWIIDAGALQMTDPQWLRSLDSVIITPHPKEFRMVFNLDATPENIEKMAKEYGVIIVVKGESDTLCSAETCVIVSGGNAGMTKGGTGDVLAGLIAALAAKNDLFLAAKAGSYINKKAGESLFKKVGYYFNASDLVEEIPLVMKELIFAS
jgi:hydroxyethylthiazole kinase-like uncharacterized protein yjeF